MDDRRRPVAQGDHLALPAGLEPRRHEECVGAGVDAACHHAIEALDERDTVRVRRDEPTERLGELRDGHSPARRSGRHARGSPARHRRRDRSPSGDRAGRSSRRPSPGRPGRTRAARAGRREQAALPPRSAREYVAAMSRSVAGSQTVVSRPFRTPKNRSPFERSRPSTPIPKAGVSASAAKVGETVLASSARSMPTASRSSPSAALATIPSPGRRPSWPSDPSGTQP